MLLSQEIIVASFSAFLFGLVCMHDVVECFHGYLEETSVVMSVDLLALAFSFPLYLEQ